MAKVKVLKESELIGGIDNSSVYPITHTKAVFNSNNKDLDQILNELEQQITSSSIQERTERIAADAELQAKISETRENTAAYLNQLKEKVDANTESINAETEARTTADAELSASISAEEASRTQRDAELTAVITAETNTRLTADSTEKEARKTADDELSKRITSEAAAREASDAELQAKIQDHEDRIWKL